MQARFFTVNLNHGFFSEPWVELSKSWAFQLVLHFSKQLGSNLFLLIRVWDFCVLFKTLLTFWLLARMKSA